MENSFLARKHRNEKIPLSELLECPPSDEILAELFPYGRKNALFITQTALKVLNLNFIAKSVGINYESDIQMAENLSCCEKGENI